MRFTVLLLALTSALTFAADNAASVPQSTANPQSAIDNRQSSIVNGVDAIAIPQMLSYQGKLTDTLGQTVGDSTYSVSFRLYTAPSGGSSFWSETQNVTTKGGLFSVLLGSVTSLGSVPDAGSLYLGMAVAGGAELTPRLRIASAAYTYLTARAADADLLQGKDTTGFVRTGQANSVTSAMITNGTIAAADLGQMGASSGQVMKWTGSAWEARNDSVGQNSGGTVRKVVQATGIVCSPNPISDSGTVGFDQNYGDGRYLNVTSDSMSGRLAVSNELRAHLRGTFGTNCTNGGNNTLVAGQGCKVYDDFCTVAGGYYNQAAEPGSYDSCATVCGGYYNFNGGKFTFIGGGRKNGCSYPHGVVCGGDSNHVTGQAGVVCGGIGNSAAQYSLVGGGVNNGAAGSYAVVVGGYQNHADEYNSAVVGGELCLSASHHSFVGGGYGDSAKAVFGGAISGNSNLAGDAADDTATVIAGGWNNTATGKFNFLGGGYQNNSSNNYSVVVGGRGNTANGPQAAVGGGWGNTASGWHSVVAGGLDNTASGTAASTSGGEDNKAGGYWSTVSGGQNDTASGTYSTVGGGYRNKAGGEGASTVAGGSYNSANLGGVVGGGNSNVASDTYAFVGGGHADTASGANSTVGGGDGNVASASCATVAGGRSNIASGDGATVPGGYYCAASGSRSFAAGSYARARGRGTFVWSDSCTAADSVFETQSNNWIVRARGGVYFYTSLDKSTGSYLSGGGSSWQSVSDSMTKENFRPVDKKALLDAVARMRVRDYNLKTQDASIRHIGPVAQDFHNAFGFGESNTAINMEDADGVALAAIQALYEQNQMLSGRIDVQQAEIEQLKAELKRR